MTESSWQESKQRVEVLGRSMAYVDQGKGPPIVLLHGNPTSSFLWRNVIAELTGVGRCVAPRPDRHGRLRQAARRRRRAVHVRQPPRVRRRVHGRGRRDRRARGARGSRLGQRARLRLGAPPSRPGSRASPTWRRSSLPSRAGTTGPSRRARSSRGSAPRRRGDDPRAEPVHRGRAPELGPAHAERRGDGRVPPPVPQPGEDRLPTLTWPRQIPIAGEPADVTRSSQAYAAWLAQAEGIPKLFVNAEPGAILTGAARDFCRTWPDQTEITVPGIHYIQEDSGPEIGRAIAAWLPA